MRFDVNPSPPGPGQTFLGLLQVLAALFLLWVGLNSTLIGWAYSLQKGAWLPVLTGIGLSLLGFGLLWKGVRKILTRFLRWPTPDDYI